MTETENYIKDKSVMEIVRQTAYRKPNFLENVSRIARLGIARIGLSQTALPEYRQIGVDLSAYQSLANADFPGMKANGIVFSINRSSSGSSYTDGKCSGFVAASKNSGMFTAIYHWCDPLVSPQANFNHYAQFVRAYNPDWIAIDVEQWWSSWEAFYQAIYGQIAWSDVPRLSPAVISESARQLAYLLKAEFPTKQIVVYSSGSFVDQYSPPMASWLGEFPYWTATYPSVETGKITWEELYSDVAALTHPYRTAGVIKERFWQFDSRRILMVANEPYDKNIFWGNIADLQRFVDGVYVPPPVPQTPVPYVVTAWVANVRRGPGLNYPIATQYVRGTPVTGYAESGNWVRITPTADIGQLWMSKTVIATNSYRVTAGTLNVRSGPGMTYPVIGYKYFGDLVMGYDEKDGWVRINALADQPQKWVSKTYLVAV